MTDEQKIKELENRFKQEKERGDRFRAALASIKKKVDKLLKTPSNELPQSSHEMVFLVADLLLDDVAALEEL